MPETLPPVDLLPVTAPATPIAIPEVVPILTLSEDTPGVQLNTTPSTSAEQQGELTPTDQNDFFSHEELLRSTLGERFVIFGDPVVDGIPVHARREDSRFLVTWTGDVQNLRHFE